FQLTERAGGCSMKRFALIAAVALLVQATGAQTLTTIEGIVLEPGTDKPLERVQVSLVPGGLRCRLRSNSSSLSNCNDTVVPGFYQLDLPGEPYIISAKAGGQDLLPDGVQIDSDAKIEIVFGSASAGVSGIVRNSKNEPEAVQK